MPCQTKCTDHSAPQREASLRGLLPGRARVLLGLALAAALSALQLVSNVAAAPSDTPGAQSPATAGGAEHHVGKVVLLELITFDLARAKLFYGSLFGWTYRDVGAGQAQYSEAFLDGIQVADLIFRAAPQDSARQPSWLTFISVGDVDAAAASAASQGAKILVRPHDVPERGREAVIADPQGSVFAILAAASGDPPDVLAAPGEWIWSSLITRDPDSDAAFYQSIFDYEVFEIPATDHSEHLILASDDYARASANSLPEGVSHAHPHWLNYVRVLDAAAVARKAVELGGRVLVTPRLDRHGGMVAVVSDPMGAPFGLLEWPEDRVKGSTQ